MPYSPFPGMDPYLEHPGLWPNVHDSLITYFRDALNERLPEGYVAAIGERVYVERERSIYPDVTLSRNRSSDPPAGGSVAVLDMEADEAWELPSEIRRRREPFIQVIAIQPDRTVVTLVEVLSPANKRAGSVGQREYLSKQDGTLQGRISLLELDLLRGGEHTVAASLEELRARGTWTYLACLSDMTRFGACTVWPIGLREPLPRVRVPLAERDKPVVVALQPLLERTYAAGRFDRLIDYSSEPPPPPLSEEDRAWVAERLRAASEGA